MTLAQCKEFLEECQEKPGWNSENSLYDLVEEYVKPRTQGTGLGLAVLMNQSAPLEVNVMVSHAWSENVEEFLRSLEATVSKQDVLFICAFSLYQCEDGHGPSIAEQLGSVAAESPFRRVLGHISHVGNRDGSLWRWREYLWILPALCAFVSITLLFAPVIGQGCLPAIKKIEDSWDVVCSLSSAPDENRIFRTGAFYGDWQLKTEGHRQEVGKALDEPDEMWTSLKDVSFCCALVCGGCAALIAVVQCSMGVYRGRMVVVPNRNCDIYTRLWCVYEIFVARALGMPVVLAHTLAAVGQAKSIDAVCGNPDDMKRIRSEIEEYGIELDGKGEHGYALVDHAILRTSKSTRHTLLLPTLLKTWPILLVEVASIRMCIIVPEKDQSWWAAEAIACFLIVIASIGGCLYYLAKRSHGRIRDTCAMKAAGASIVIGLAISAVVGVLSIFVPDADGVFIWPCVLASGSFFITGGKLLVFVWACRYLPTERNSRLRLASCLSKMVWRSQFVLIALAALGATTVNQTATISFYAVLTFSVLAYPVAALSSAIEWDVRFECAA